MLLVKAPVPEGTPCWVLVDRAMVGPVEVFQTTPYWVGLGMPRLVMLPPLIAEVCVMLEAA